MNSPEHRSPGGRNLLVIARLSYRDYVTGNGHRTVVWSVLSRALLQVLFFTLLGRSAGATAGRDFAFVGAIAFVPVGATVTKVTDVILPDLRQGTMYRLRLGGVPILALAAVRSWIYLVEGVTAAALTLAVLGPPLVGPALTVRLAAAFPLVVFTAASCLCLGLFACALGVGGFDEGLTANGLAYLVLLFGGVVAPTTNADWLRFPALVLPLHAGLDAIRSLLAGDPYLPSLLHEAAVAALWLFGAAVTLRAQEHRLRAGAVHDKT